MNPIRILHLEDSPADAKLVKAHLASAGLVRDIIRVDTKQDYITALETKQVDLILSDFSMAGFNGKEALSIAHGSYPDIPFIFVSGTIGEEAAVESLTSGATDYVLKHNFSRLIPAVQRAIRESCEHQQQREMQEALRLSERKYRLLFERLKDGILISSPAGAVIDTNPAAAEMLGYSQSELLQLPSTLALCADKDKWTAIQRTIEEKGFVQNVEIELLRRDGKRVLVLTTVTAERDEHGEISAYQAILHDMTEQRSLEHQLQQSQKMEAVGRLAGGVAHDFNNLLTIILGHSELMAASLPPESPAQSNLHEVLKAGQRGAGLTRQLLSFSRKQVVQPRVLDLNGTITSSQRMLERLIGESVEVVLSLDPSLAKVKVDPTHIEQIILNTAINARDAMPHGGKLIIRTSNVTVPSSPDTGSAVDRDYVVLAISDTGCGIDAAVLPHIFEPFFTTKGDKGTGLGLATVFGIVKQNGGFITTDSAVDYGTTFKIYFPKTMESVSAESRPSTVELRGRETILLAEDDDGLRELTKSSLEARGYTVLCASNGRQALDVAAKHSGRIHLLLTDVAMPLMHGKQLADEILKSRPDIVVVFMSGYTDDVIVEHDLKHENVQFLEKPFTSGDLHSKIRDAVKVAARMRLQVLVIDDDHDVCAYLSDVAKRAGHSVFSASDGIEAVKLLRQLELDVVVTDLVMPCKDGIDLIVEIRRDWPNVTPIVVSELNPYLNFVCDTFPDVTTITKPVNPDDLLRALQNIGRARMSRALNKA